MYNISDFTNKQHDKTYSGNITKSIVSKTLPKNTILYTYLNIDFQHKDNAWANTDNELKKKLILQYILRNSFNITYNHSNIHNDHHYQKSLFQNH